MVFPFSELLLFLREESQSRFGIAPSEEKIISELIEACLETEFHSTHPVLLCLSALFESCKNLFPKKNCTAMLADLGLNVSETSINQISRFSIKDEDCKNPVKKLSELTRMAGLVKRSKIKKEPLDDTINHPSEFSSKK